MNPTNPTNPRIKPYLQLMRLDKPIGIFLLLWPTLWALWLASGGHPDRVIVIIFCAGVLVMRSAGCIINDIADRKVDGFIERTKNRPLITGDVTVLGAFVLFGSLMLSALLLVSFLNALALKLAFVGAFLAVVYPFLKRYTHLPQLGLGFAFAWGIPMAYAAEMRSFPGHCWLIYFITVLWVIIYDTEYALADRPDDVKIGLKSTAILFGQYAEVIIGLLQMLMIVLLILMGKIVGLHYSYYLSIGGVLLLFGYQQFLLYFNKRDLCFRAFLNNHWVGAILFGGIFFSL